MDMVDNGMDEQIDEMATDFAMQMKEVTLATLDRITGEVNRLLESVRKVNGRQTCFGSVLKLALGQQSTRGFTSTGSKRHSLQAVELSQRTQAAVQIVSNLPAPSNGGPIYLFLGMPAMRTRWMAGVAAHKSG